MNNNIKHWFKSFYTLHKGEQRGVLILLFLLVLLVCINLFLPKVIRQSANTDPGYQKDVKQFVIAQQRLNDSLKINELQKKGELTQSQAARLIHPFPFDPNKISEKQWKQMGLSQKQIKNILNYRSHGGIFSKKSDLQRIYSLSEAEYLVLKPYIRIKKVNKSEKEKRGRATAISSRLSSLEINNCDSGQLVRNLRLKPWLAARVIKYRHLLGGFYSKLQLKDVYGLKPELFQKIAPYIKVDTNRIHKIDLNHAQFKTILHHPYFDYKTTRRLIYMRNKIHGFRSLTQLKAQHLFSDSVFNNIRHYLYIRPLKN